MIGLTAESSFDEIKNYTLLCIDEGVFDVFVDPFTYNRIAHILCMEMIKDFGLSRVAYVDEERVIFHNVFFKQTKETGPGSSSTWRGFRFKTLIL